MLEKEKEYRNNKGFETTEEQSTDSEEDEVTASEKSHSQETENSDHEAESEIEDSDSESVQSYSKRIQIRVNTVKAQMFTLRSWNVPSAFGMITVKFALSAVRIFLWTGNIWRRKSRGCFGCGADTLQPKGIKKSFYPPEEKED